MPTGDEANARTFYLNEQHELVRGEKEPGGRPAQYHGIDWASKGRVVASSLSVARDAIIRSRDPLREQHYFLLAQPVETIQKKSAARNAVHGVISAPVRFDQTESKVFRRLGIDLIDVTETGKAVVHIRPERIEQLMATGTRLGEVGKREQARWASLGGFETIPPDLRLDGTWVRSLRSRVPSDAVIEFHPLIGRVEVETLIHSIGALLRMELRERLTNMGMDFSGRHWVRGQVTPETLKTIAKLYYSVQTLHSPLNSFVLSTKRGRSDRVSRPQATQETMQDPAHLPTVGVLDTGVPNDHAILGRFRRGQYVAPDSIGQPAGNHGTFVSSRVVFGDPDSADGPPRDYAAGCRYYDVLVAEAPDRIHNKSVVPAIQSVVANAPDVRVFNLSFDTRPIELQAATERRENLILVQDLDNLIFRDDIIVVVSAGNSPAGEQPDAPYPFHFNDPDWQLGAWARSFNSLTCGSYVAKLYPGGLVSTIGWPSPFTRVGPGMAKSPKPDFSAHGGNGNEAMTHANGLGVWGLSASANWEDNSGTSFAAPLLAREAARAFQMLQKVCTSGGRPYAITVRAFLTLTATPPNVQGAAEELAMRALGKGTASHERLSVPRRDSAVLIWQGLLENTSDIARVTVPIPTQWLAQARQPKLRIVACWDPPVNSAVSGLWATRKVTVHLKANPDGRSLHGSRGGHLSYPVIDRVYDLRRMPAGESIDGNTWLIEMSYEELCDSHPSIAFTPQQRVAFAAELFDEGENAISPQSSIQALPSAVTMARLSIPPQAVRMPVVIKPIG
ncbi:MAG: S8 family serine peptidase [Bryobacteraceae bacterium]|nr:S8 family serine peptidase [Bryobacteraceae bacterium]